MVRSGEKNAAVQSAPTTSVARKWSRCAKMRKLRCSHGARAAHARVASVGCAGLHHLLRANTPAPRRARHAEPPMALAGYLLTAGLPAPPQLDHAALEIHVPRFARPSSAADAQLTLSCWPVHAVVSLSPADAPHVPDVTLTLAGRVQPRRHTPQRRLADVPLAHAAALLNDDLGPPDRIPSETSEPRYVCQTSATARSAWATASSATSALRPS